MPIFGLVWVASWVNCFFSSSQALLHTPASVASVLSIQTASPAARRVSGSRGATRSVSHDRSEPGRSELARSFAQRQAFEPSVRVFQALPASLLLPMDAKATSPPLSLLSAFKELFAGGLFSGFQTGFQKLTVSHPPSVVVTDVEPLPTAPSSLVSVDTAGLGFGQCLPIAQPPRSAIANNALGNPSPYHPALYNTSPDNDSPANNSPANNSPANNLFQVKVKQAVVSAASNRQEAVQIAQRLEQMLKTAQPQLNQLQPGMVNGRPVGKLGDRVLFTVDTEVAEQWDCTPDVLAIQWVNALRMAMEQAPLAIADAQATMYGLHPTGRHLDGLASWYGPFFHGRQTATGETFNQNDLTAAHPSLPFDTYLKVTNVANGKAVIVRINDRGPYFENRALDLSHEAARFLDSETVGVVTVKAEIMEPSNATAPPNQAIAQRL